MAKNVAVFGYVLLLLSLVLFVFSVYAEHERFMCAYYWECGKWISLRGSMIGLSVIAFLVISVGYLMMGLRYERASMTRLGVLGIITFVVIFATITYLGFVSVQAWFAEKLKPSYLEFSDPLGAYFAKYGFDLRLLPLYGASALLLLAWSVYEVKVLWSASKFFSSLTLKVAALAKAALIAMFIGAPAFHFYLAVIGKGKESASLGLPTIVVVGTTYLAVQAITAAALLKAREPKPEEKEKEEEKTTKTDLPWLDFPAE